MFGLIFLGAIALLVLMTVSGSFFTRSRGRIEASAG